MIPVESGQLRDLDVNFHKHDTPRQKEIKRERQEVLQWCLKHTEDIENKAKGNITFLKHCDNISATLHAYSKTIRTRYQSQ